MIYYVRGNLFSSRAKVLINTVNTVGVMGKGIAAEFKKIYPQMFKEYKKLCENKELDIGKLHLYKTSNKWILNFPTKKHWRSPSTIEYIEKGLQTLVKEANYLQLSDIAMPKLGCGNGGLDWETEVKPIVEKYLKKAPINVTIYDFNKDIVPEYLSQKDIQKWLQADPDSLTFSLFFEDLVSLTMEGLFLKEIVLLGNKYKIFYNSIDENFQFNSDNKLFTLSKEDFKFMFHTLRNIGKLCKSDIYTELQEYSDEILEFIAMLPYIIKNDDKIVLSYIKNLKNVEELDFD